MAPSSWRSASARSSAHHPQGPHGRGRPLLATGAGGHGGVEAHRVRRHLVQELHGALPCGGGAAGAHRGVQQGHVGGCAPKRSEKLGFSMDFNGVRRKKRIKHGLKGFNFHVPQASSAPKGLSTASGRPKLPPRCLSRMLGP